MASRYRAIPSPQDWATKFASAVQGVRETIVWTWYHFQAYAAAGQQQLQFFGSPWGQLANGYADSNMELAGQLPAGTNFLAEALCFWFKPSGKPSLGSQAEGAQPYTNDVDAFANGLSYVEFKVGNKVYDRMGPLVFFPAGAYLAGFAALSDATTAAASELSSISYAAPRGRERRYDPPVPITGQVNFSVTINWPAAVALPSGQAGRIGAFLLGLLDRPVQ